MKNIKTREKILKLRKIAVSWPGLEPGDSGVALKCTNH